MVKNLFPLKHESRRYKELEIKVSKTHFCPAQFPFMEMPIRELIERKEVQ